jgi:hypothetical protein
VKFIIKCQTKSGSSFLLPAHGRAGASATINNDSPSASEKILAKPRSRWAKRREGGENEFLPACSAPKARQGWEAARPCVSKESKPAKIVSLIVRQLADCARFLKEKEIFGLCPPSGGEPLGGFCARQGVECRSKWVRAAFSNCESCFS